MIGRVALTVVGYVFLALGVVGLFLPFLQGILFLVVGLLILSRHAPWAERLLERLKRSHPKLAQTIITAEDTAERWMDKVAGGIKRLFGRA